MSDPKPAGLQPVEERDVLDLAGEVLAAHHHELAEAGARIRWFWLLNKRMTVWGQTKVLPELAWWLSGDMDGYDVAISLNSALWGNLQRAGRFFLIDHRLSLVLPKEGGAEEMDTTAGTRRLYQAVKHDLGVSPAVIARNPEGFAQIAELKELQNAIRDPAQFLLDLRAAEELDEEDDGGGEGEDEEEGASVTFRREPEPSLFYYGTHRFDTGLRAGWLVYFKFSGPEKTASQLVGVHFPPDQSPDPANGAIDKGILAYDESPEAVATYRADLTRDLEERQREAVSESGEAVDLGTIIDPDGEPVRAVGVDGELIDPEPDALDFEDEPGLEDEPGAEVVQMAGRARR